MSFTKRKISAEALDKLAERIKKEKYPETKIGLPYVTSTGEKFYISTIPLLLRS